MPKLFCNRIFRTLLVSACAALMLLGGSACQTLPGTAAERRAMMEAIRNEPPGDYFVGRRYYTNDYKFWGYVRRPREAWSAAEMVVLNENQQFAPDRAAGQLGKDDNFEYRLEGYFSGDMVYEPASNRFYPEFVLQGYELVSRNPPNIYSQGANRTPGSRTIYRPR